VHDRIDVCGSTCPFALFLAALLQKSSGESIFAGISIFTKNGTKTELFKVQR